MQPVGRAWAASARAAAPSLRAIAEHGGAVPVRNAVNLSALKLRIRATNNVAKITNVMKLVASSKLRGVEEALARGRTFGESLFNAVALKTEEKKAEAAAAAGGAPKPVDEDEAQGIFLDDKKHLVLCVTTDRGLCGSVNSSLTRSLRKELNAATAANKDVRVVTLGEKGRQQIARDYTPLMARAVDGYMDRDPIFALASSIASRIVSEPYDVLTLWYNHYENQIKFHNVHRKIPKLAGMGAGVVPPSLKGYEIEPAVDDTLSNLEEYAVASALFYVMLETVACETSQRVTAMDNASTNAKDMVDRFKLIYNRARQAKITTELTEIISGAESIAVSGPSD